MLLLVPRTVPCLITSWGLETTQPRWSHSVPYPLITPHGDWKLARPPGRYAAERLLITPHGDWKPCFIDPVHDPSSLITPHGDWKRPLAELLLRPRVDLITPHGDWKPDPVRGSRGRDGAHYPSWGLETHKWYAIWSQPPHLITPHGDWKLGHDVGFPNRPAVASLPLMGIGNPTAASWGTRLPLSLPLMGIGNAGGRAGGGGAHGLITPHGDWKRRQRRRRGRRLIGSHYPSWGLETRAGREFPVTKFFLLITPHGDWKPPYLPSPNGDLRSSYAQTDSTLAPMPPA